MRWLGISPSVEKASAHILVCWIAPPTNWAKLNSDGPQRGTLDMRVAAAHLEIILDIYYLLMLTSMVQKLQLKLRR